MKKKKIVLQYYNFIASNRVQEVFCIARFKARLYCKVQVVLQYWLLGVGLCHNIIHCIVTEARQGLYCNTVIVPTIQQGHGRWACRDRAQLGVLGVGATGAGERRTRWERQAWARGAQASARAAGG